MKGSKKNSKIKLKKFTQRVQQKDNRKWERVSELVQESQLKLF